MKHFYCALFLLVAFLFFSLDAHATIRYVKPGAQSTAWQGKSNVYSDLQLALADAVSGDEIWVAAGLYKPTTGTDRTISFQLGNGVKLYGGFSGNETVLTQRNWQLNKTVLSGNIGSTSLSSDNSCQVLQVLGTSESPYNNLVVIDGVIIEDGYADILTNNRHRAGGLLVTFAKLQVSNTWIRNCYAIYDGGGSHVDAFSDVTFANVIFTNNRANRGGGLYDNGNIDVINSLFYNNTAAHQAGALYRVLASDRSVVNSIFWANRDATGVKHFWLSDNVTYSCVEGGLSGVGNISDNPNFSAPANGNFNLSSDSPCINKGSNASVPSWLKTDFSGRNRIVYGQVDMGPFEADIHVLQGVYPLQNEMLLSSTTEVTLKWRWLIDAPDDILQYNLSYRIGNAGWQIVNNISDFEYNLTGLTPGSVIEWYVSAVSQDDEFVTETYKFSVRSNGPLHVKANGNGTGFTWSDATSLQHALSIANAGDEIWVAAGIYYPTSGSDRNASFVLKDGVSLYGGFEGTETSLQQRNWRTNQTILSGNIGNAALDTDNSYHVVKAVGNDTNPVTDATLFDGFIIEKGYANQYSNDNNNGGGILLLNASPRVVNVWFRNNYSASRGGAVYGNGTSNAVFANVIFTDNRSNDDGAGAYALGPMTFYNCLWYNNEAVYYGSAVATNSSSNNVRVINSIAWKNPSYRMQPEFRFINLDNVLVLSNTGATVIAQDPAFLDEDDYDFRLRAGSPAVGSGNGFALPQWVTIDYFGNPILPGNTVNLGPIQGEVVTPAAVSPSYRDVLSNLTTATLEWGWDGKGVPQNHSSFTLEYKIDNGNVNVVNGIAALSYPLSGLSPSNKVNWRVASVDHSGNKSWSAWSEFFIKRISPIYVKSNGTGTGASWATATNLQSALANAIPSDEIWVAAGTHRPTATNDRNASFKIGDDIKLLGGFSGTETQANQRNWRANETILCGDIGTLNVNTDNCYNVVTIIGTFFDPITSSTRMDGFIIQNGNASLSYRYTYLGAGLYVSKASPVITNVWFRNNVATGSGGAVFVENSADYEAVFGNVLFTGNHSNGSGGGASGRPGVSYYNCVWYNNSASNSGGGLAANMPGTKVVNSIFWENSAGNSSNDLTNVTTTNSLFLGASATGHVNANPLFYDSDGFDFTLRDNSPALNAGNVEMMPDWLDFDFNGAPRVADGKINMGLLQGFVTAPINAFPAHNQLIEFSDASVNLEWTWLTEIPEGVLSYTLEYQVSGESVQVVPNISGTSYALSGLAGSSHVKWRVSAVTGSGDMLWSYPSEFIISRAHPIYVSTNGIGDGTSWENAANLPAALAMAIPGDKIWVSAGTYKPSATGDRTASFQLKDRVSLFGGFKGDETELTQRNWHLNKTILSGDIGASDVNTDNSYRVVSAIGTSANPISTETIFDGFIVERGYADFINSNNNHRGAGMYFSFASPMIRNVWFRDNFATGNGGAVYYLNASSSVFANVIFTNNGSNTDGGAVYVNSGVSFINCLWHNNTASGWGGAIRGGASGNSIVNSILWGNLAGNSNQISNVLTTYSLIEGGYSGIGNLSDNPLLISPENSDFRLAVGSPAVGAGNVVSVPQWLLSDYAGMPRIVEGKVNMGPLQGAVETPVISYPLNNEFLSADITTVELSWTWKNAVPENHATYLVEYVINGNVSVQSEALTETVFELSGLNPLDLVSWRVASVDNGGALIWTQKSEFRIRRGQPIYVKPDGTGDGSSWESATGLQSALSMALASDEIWASAGTYKPTNDNDRIVSFRLKDKVELYGGFAGDETSREQRNWHLHKTILSGDIGEPDVNTDNSYRVVSAVGTADNPITTETIFDGFIVERGYADFNSSNNHRGGGMYLIFASPSIRNVWFRDNFATSFGGAIYYANASASVFANVIFTNNRSNADGGAVYVNSGVSFVNCLWYNNYSGDWGGAIRGTSSGNSIVNSILWGNQAAISSNNISNVLTSYSIVEGGYSGIANLNVNPLIFNPQNGDFRLRTGSPAVESGSVEALPDWLLTDYLGKPRVTESKVNRGPIQGFVVTPSTHSPESGTYIDLDASIVQLAWIFDNEQTSNHLHYLVEYVINDGVTEVSEPITEKAFELSGLNSLDKVAWRVASEDAIGNVNWSGWSEFFVTRGHPIFVTENGTGDGSSWANATSLKVALNMALPTDEIWVAAGTYMPTDDDDRTASFQLKDRISLYGGFAGTETAREERNWNLNKTILSGNIGDANIAEDNSYRVVSAVGTIVNPITTETIFDGFIVERGYADFNSNNHHRGGGMYLSFASPMIRNVWFRDNFASGFGGAVYYLNSSSSVFANVIFTNNRSNSDGGAVNVNSGVSFVNCLWYNNYSDNWGGAIRGSSSGSSIVNSIFWNNRAAISSNNVSNLTATYSILEGGYSGTGNINENPLFIDAAAFDFRLQSDSPALESGNIDAIPQWLMTDYFGSPRVNDNKVSRGPIEGGNPVPVIVSPQNGEIFASDVSSMELVWMWNNAQPASHLYYVVEYSVNGANVVVSEPLTDQTFEIAEVNPFDKFTWRVASVDAQGNLNWSNWSDFIIRRDGPFFVKSDGTGDGSSWANAAGLQFALNQAVFGDEIWMAAGIYKPTSNNDRTISFIIKDGIKLFGGFAGTETGRNERNWHVNKTILSGNIGDINVAEDNSYRVIIASGTMENPISSETVLDGFIVEGGYANSFSNNNHRGAGLFLNNASPLIRNVWFRDNFADGVGGAVSFLNASTSVFANVIFTNNRSDSDGGAVFVHSGVSFINCLWYANYSGDWGGAIRGNSSGSTIVNSILWGNQAARNFNNISNVSTTYSLVGENYSGTGNIIMNPLLVDPDNDDFRLRKGSPALDSGNIDAVPEWLLTDFAGSLRVDDNKVNMGPLQGYIVAPVIIAPLDKHFFNSDISEVELTWGWEDEEAEGHQYFYVEYMINDDPVELTSPLVEASFELSSLNPTDGIRWRVASVDAEGVLTWTAWSGFRIKRETPIYVTVDGTGDGFSWATAANIQTALANAIEGDEIWVASGVYKPTDSNDRTISFELRNNVSLYGGFAGTETERGQRNWSRNQTILSGDIGDPGVATDNSYHVLTAIGLIQDMISTETVFDGFIVEGGYATSFTNNDYMGGGISLSHASPLIRNVWFRDNYAIGNGGAVSFLNSSSSVFANVIFTNNRSEDDGGAVSVHSGVSFINCLWYANYSGSWGGAIRGHNSGSTIVNSILWGNQAAISSNNISNVSTTYSLVVDSYSGTGNKFDSPLLLDPDNGDFRLRKSSPAMNSGNVNALPDWLLTDFAGAVRVDDNNVNMGPLQGFVVAPVILAPGDKQFFDSDFSEVELTWGWEDEVAEGHQSYSIEYMINDGPIEITEPLSETMFELCGLNPTDSIRWRVASADAEGALTWTAWSGFRIRRETPLYVTVNGTGDGFSWATATNLQSALANAIDGDEIWVASGVYKPTESIDRTISFELKNNVSLYGGFAGNETTRAQRNWSSNKTILSGNIGDAELANDNSYHVVKAIGSFNNPISTETVFDGFIVEDGFANYVFNFNNRGAGIILNNASPRICNVWFRNNFANGFGGGVYFQNPTASVFANVIFTNNRSNSDGGAVYVSSGVSFVNCLWYDNYSGDWGGAIYSNSSGSSIVNSILWGNRAANSYNQAGNMSVSNSIVEGGYSGTGNLSVEPMFIDAENGDFRLLKGSPAIGKGNNTRLPEWLVADYDGFSRVYGNNADIGPYEYKQPVTVTPADKGAASSYNMFLGLEFIWGLSDGETTPITTLVPGTKYRIQVWAKNNPEQMLHDQTFVPAGGLFELNQNSIALDGFDFGAAYEWRVALVQDEFELWSDVSLFYMGRGHVIHVKAGNTGTSGSDWSDAFGTLHEALEQSIPGDEIWVAAGTYYPVTVENTTSVTEDERQQALSLKPGLMIYGGFNGTEMIRQQRNYAANPTIISGDLSNSGVEASRSYNLFRIESDDVNIINRTTFMDGLILEQAAQSAMVNKNASPTVYNTIFRYNNGENGAAVRNEAGSSPLFYQALMHHNNASVSGGAVWSDATSSATLINATVGLNQAPTTGGVNGAATVYNSIVYGNTNQQLSGAVDVRNSCVEGGFAGESNTGFDPLWVDAEAANFRLSEFSSCIDMGNVTLMPEMPTYDLDFKGRLMNLRVDIGAYEAQSKGTVLVTETSISDELSLYNDYILVRFDHPVAYNSEVGLVVDPLFNYSVVKGSDDYEIRIYYSGMDTETQYRITIPANAVRLATNPNIWISETDLIFTVTSVSDIHSDNFGTMTVWPNPVKAGEMVRVTVPHSFGAKRIQLLDASGRVMTDAPVDSFSDVIELDQTNFLSGIYIIQVVGDNNRVLWQKLMIK
ncbi:T9SS type A sorting domain-containing protein [Alkaliflexus imshenetskii]|uniref:T9SS type A sorting domain-containing protein n=1 Tax=Alkaliflexus imshenetskii TaxID=286730 RepID=UPI0004B3399B|nr:T9SS type A sorting domain-containing protein [Alkaliflexus imshenetskii]